jgi:hypothetical protein
MPAAKAFKAYKKDRRKSTGKEERETFQGEARDLRRRDDKDAVVDVVGADRGCLVVEDGRPRRPVCSDEGDGSSSTIVVAAQEYFAAELASHSELRRKVIANLISPIKAYMPKTG